MSFAETIRKYHKDITEKIASISVFMSNSYAEGSDIDKLEEISNKKIKEFNLYKEDEIFVSILVTINQYVGNNRSNIMVSGKKKRWTFIDCPDDIFEKRAISVKNSIMKLYRIGSLSVFASKKRMYLFLRTLDIVTNLPSLLKSFIFDKKQATSRILVKDASPLAIGVFFNFLILFMTFVFFYTEKSLGFYSKT